MVVRNLMVRVGADLGPMQKAFKKAAKQTKQFRQNFSNNAKALARTGLIMGAAITAASYKSIQAAEEEMVAQKKLAVIMKQRMNASNGTVQSMIDLASAQQKVGVIEDGAQVSGAQMLATFLKQSDSLKTLIPAMNDLAAQQYGVNASSEDLVTIGKMMGKVFTGQTGALKKAGITFDSAQEKILKYGTESEKAAMLSKIITQNVGDMNEELGKTPAGRMAQLKNSFGDLQEKFGAAIMPLRDAFVPVLQKAVQYFSDLVDKMQPAIAYAKVFLETLFNVKAANSMDAVSNSTGKAAKGMKDLGKATAKTGKGLLGFDQINQLQEESVDNIEDQTDATKEYGVEQLGVADAFVLTAQRIDEAKKKAEEFKKMFFDTVATVKTLIPAAALVVGAITTIKTAAALISFGNAISGIAKTLGAAQGLNTVIATVGTTSLATGASMAAWAGIIGASVATLAILIKSINDAQAAIDKFTKQVDSNVKQANVTIPNALAKMTPEQVKQFAEAFKQSSKTSIADATYQFDPFALIRPWLDSLTSTKNLSGAANFNPAYAGAKASGGFVDRGQMFVANEAGAEMVGSMDGKTAVANNQQIIEGIKRGVMEGMSNSNQSIKLVIGGVEFEQIISRTLKNYNRRTGGSLA